MQPLYAVYGTGGCGRGIMPLAASSLENNNISLDRLMFIDDNNQAKEINGHTVVDYKEFLALDASEKFVSIAISESDTREKIYSSLIKNGINLWSLSADNVVIMDNVLINEGFILSPFVCLTSNIRIGICFQANLYSYIEHDCLIGDYVTFAPGVKCNGNVIIEDYAYIGSGAVIRQGTPDKPLIIGKRAVVGMGAVVTKDVPEGTVVVGNPAKLHKY